MKKEHYIEQLQKLYNEEKYFELEKLCLKLVTTYEESFIYFFLGQAQINLNLTNIGEYHLKKAIFLNPNSVISFNALGDLYLTFQKLEMAKKDTGSLTGLRTELSELYTKFYKGELTDVYQIKKTKQKIAQALTKEGIA